LKHKVNDGYDILGNTA